MAAREFRILLVEDNPADARLTIEAFRETRAGVHLSHVASGNAALDFLRRCNPYTHVKCPDLILLDLNLPGLDGRQVLAEIKSDPALRHIPVIILTTSHADADVMQAYNLKANCYLKKPTQLDSFRGIVRSIDQFWFSTALLTSAE
jgi:chemotaxis family two-component system response regulator Rcp1